MKTNYYCRNFIYSLLFFISVFSTNAYAQLGKCKGKYLGNIIQGNVRTDYNTYWNQATSENGSKWGSVEGSQGNYNFSTSDVSYNWAKNNGGLFKYHNFVWGSQTPGWVGSASTATITAAVQNYIKACSTHYTPMGGLKLIDVVNEPVNTALSANYKAALTAGYQAEPANANDKNNQYGWVIWPFQLARKYFPNAELLINEYNIEMNWNNCRTPYIAMVNAIKNAPNLTDGQKNLINGVGLQCHGIENLTAANFKACIDEIYSKTGVPIHITEFDTPANPNEAKQQAVYSTLIPVAWEHPNVNGITLWGYIQGTTWINGNGVTGSGGTDSGIKYASGTERPALTWLKQYMAGRPNVAGCGTNASPTVSITSPANNATFTAPGSITINANATDADGTISNVQFYNGTTLLGSDATSPYSFVWTNVAAGTYSLTAKATDNASAVTTSSVVTVVVNAVTANTPPTVSITSPANNAAFTAPASITINANAADANGTISNVQFYNGATLLGSDATSPYSFVWANIAAGTYSLTAVATDNASATTTSAAIMVTVTGTTTTLPDPNLHIYLCFGQSNMEGQGPIESQDLTVNSRFQVMGAVTCTGTRSFTLGKWAPATPPVFRCDTKLSPADYFGRTMVANLPTNIKIGIVPVAVAGCDIALFDKINYASYVATAPSYMIPIINAYGGNPYQRLVDAAKLAQKDGVIKGILLHQGETNNGQTTWPAKVKAVYDNLIKDLGLDPTKTPLLVGETVTTAMGGTCGAHNAVIATVPSVIPNSYVISASGLAPQSDNLHFTSASYRTLGERYATRMLSLLTATTNTAPTVSLTSPANNATFPAPASITINANAADADGTISNVQFYNGTTLLGSDATSPYSFIWANVAAGTYTITAKATDNASATTTSTAITIVVSGVTTNTPPTASITSPANNASFIAPASITINANAADADGTISNVQFYNGTTLLGSDATSPYSFVWANVAAGTYIITAKATDNSSAITTSTEVTVTVTTTSIAQAPYNGTPAAIPGTIQVEDYDLGGQGIAFNELTTGNSGNATFRGDDVDLETTSDVGGGYNLGWATNGEWLEYTVNVTTAGNYNMDLRIAVDGTGRTLNVTMDGVNISGTVSLPTTGGYQTWQTITVGNIALTAGQKVMRLTMTADYMNINYISFSSIVPNTAPTVSITSPANNAAYTTPASITINANAADTNGTVSNVGFYNGTTLLGNDATAPYSFTWNNVAAGTYIITARATDNAGAVTTSSAITVVVSAAPVLDCNGVAEGTAFLDACLTCVGGNTGKTACVPNTSCRSILIPLASDWVVLNDWSDQNSGTGLSTTTEAMKVAHRQWGRDYVWLIESAAKRVKVQAGKAYTISFDFKDDASTKVTSLQVGLASGIDWSGPVLAQPMVAMPSGTSSSAYNNKSVNITATASGDFYLVIREQWAGQVSLSVNNFIKNLTICEVAVAAKSALPESSLNPNPSAGSFTLTASENITSFIVSNTVGVVVYKGNSLSEGESVMFGDNFSSTIYILNIVYSSGRTESKLIQKL